MVGRRPNLGAGPVDPRLLPPQPLQLWQPDPVEPLYDALQYGGHGFPPRAGEGDGPPRTAWERLTRGQPLGKRAILLYNADSENEQVSPVPFFQIRGDNCDAQPITLMIAPPRVHASSFADLIALTNENYQNLSGDQDNYEVADADFPDDTTPITWPPLQVEIRWGSAGAPPVKAIVDIMNGVTVNLTASFVEAVAYIATTDDNGIAGTSAAYALTAYIAPGYKRPGDAQNTVYVGNVEAGAESNIFRVPRFAKRAFIVANDPGTAPVATVATLRFWQNVVGAGNAGAQNVGNFLNTGNSYLPVNVPNGGLYFSVLSGMGTTQRFSVVFDLSI